MILNGRDNRHKHILNVARQMMTAACTASKGKGTDTVETAVITGKEIQLLSDTLKVVSEETRMKFLLRDADGILRAKCIPLIDIREQVQGLNCGHCDCTTCAGHAEGMPCTLNSADMSTTIDSACATAADLRVDTHVVFSTRLAVQCPDWLERCRQVMAVPVSASSESSFFDRKSNK